MFKCKICGKEFTSLPTLLNHIENKHKEMIPKDMTVHQYYYYLKTGKTNGSCVMCKKPTSWNSNTNKYNRFCDDPRCKEKYREMFKDRMIKKYGKVHLLDDPDKQREMLAHRKISGEYKWNNSSIKTQYTGSYELDFLKLLDNFFDWDPEDILMPSPHTYTYMYEGEQKFYIPDAFIPSIGLEIEIKDGGLNPNNHHKIQDVDKVKEKAKDDVLISQKSFHYIKIYDKNYINFFNFLKKYKEEFEKYDDVDKMPRIFLIKDLSARPVMKDIKESFRYNDILEESKKINDVKDILKQKAKESIRWTNTQYEKEVEDFAKRMIEPYMLHVKSSFTIKSLKTYENSLKKELEELKQNSSSPYMPFKTRDNKKFINDVRIKAIEYVLEYEIPDREKFIKKRDKKMRIDRELKKTINESTETILTEDITSMITTILSIPIAKKSNGELSNLDSLIMYDIEANYHDAEKIMLIMQNLIHSSTSDSDLRYTEYVARKTIDYYKRHRNAKNLDKYESWLRNEYDSTVKRRKKELKAKKYNEQHYTLRESTIPFALIGDYLKADDEKNLTRILNQYKKTCKTLRKEKPELSPSIDSDIKKAMKYINDLQKKDEIRDELALMAKNELGKLCESNETIITAIMENNNSDKIFTLRDNTSKIYIGDKFYIQRPDSINSVNCIVSEGNIVNDIADKKIIQYKLKRSKPFDENSIMESYIANGIPIYRLFDINDTNNSFLHDLCNILTIDGNIKRI